MSVKSYGFGGSENGNGETVVNSIFDYPFTVEEVEQMIVDEAAKTDSSLVNKYGQNLLAGLPSSFAPAKLGKNRNEDIIQGCGLYENCLTGMRNAGPLMIAIMRNNFNVNDFQMRLAQRNQEVRYNISLAASDIGSLGDKPVIDDYFMRARNKIAIKEKELKEKYTKSFGEWSTQTKKSSAASKKSTGDVAEAVLNVGNLLSEEDAFILAFKESKDYILYETHLNEYTKNMNLEAEGLYLKDKDEYNIELRKIEIKKTEMAIQKESLKDDNVVQAVCIGIKTWLTTFANKIIEAVMFHSEIATKLKGKAVIVGTNEVVQDPMAQGNASGMFMILQKEYASSSLVVFNRELTKLLDRKELDVNCDLYPGRATANARTIRQDWERMKLFEYLTPDTLMVSSFLCALPSGCNLRVAALTHLHKIIGERKEKGTEEPTKGYPLFDNMLDWIDNEYKGVIDNAGGVKNSSSKQHADADGVSDGGGGGGGGAKALKKLGKFKSGTGLESAAAATTAVKPGGPPVKTMVTPNQEGYVTRDAMLFVASKNFKTGVNHDALYTATKDQCKKCIDPDRSKRCGVPFCYVAQCYNCFLWGHKNSECHQLVQKSSGNV